jgi:hypothetical protein
MSIPPAPNRWPAWLPLTIIVSAALCVRLALAPAYAYLPDDYLDERFWTSWMFAIHDRGVLNVFRTTEANYVGYQWVLWLLSIAYDWMGGAYGLGDTKLHLLVKAPSIVADLALIVVVYHATAALAGATGGASQGAASDGASGWRWPPRRSSRCSRQCSTTARCGRRPTRRSASRCSARCC